MMCFKISLESSKWRKPYSAYCFTYEVLVSYVYVNAGTTKNVCEYFASLKFDKCIFLLSFSPKSYLTLFETQLEVESSWLRFTWSAESWNI